jgi:hypothetical protein
MILAIMPPRLPELGELLPPVQRELHTLPYVITHLLSMDLWNEAFLKQDGPLSQAT